MRTLEELLEQWIDTTAIWTDGRVYKIKGLVDSINDLQINVWPDDHNPPHFHVKSTQRNINATFFLDTLELRTDSVNTITNKDVKKIQAFFSLEPMRKKLYEKYKAMQQK